MLDFLRARVRTIAFETNLEALSLAFWMSVIKSPPGHGPCSPQPMYKVYYLFTAPSVLALGLDPQAGPMRHRMFQKAIPLYYF